MRDCGAYLSTGANPQHMLCLSQWHGPQRPQGSACLNGFLGSIFFLLDQMMSIEECLQTVTNVCDSESAWVDPLIIPWSVSHEILGSLMTGLHSVAENLCAFPRV